MFNVSISIDNASVSSTANSMEDVWALMVPALMAAGFDLEVQILYSLHDYVEKDGKYLVMSQEDFDKILDEARQESFEEGLVYAKSGGKSESKDQSLCGND